jgi:hypothetical protein
MHGCRIIAWLIIRRHCLTPSLHVLALVFHFSIDASCPAILCLTGTNRQSTNELASDSALGTVRGACHAGAFGWERVRLRYAATPTAQTRLSARAYLLDSKLWNRKSRNTRVGVSGAHDAIWKLLRLNQRQLWLASSRISLTASKSACSSPLCADENDQCAER